MSEKLGTEIRREQIALAALALVAERGLDGLSVANVARRVGIVPSAIYRHYAGKEAVIEAVLRLVRDRLLDNVRAVSAEAADPLDRLHRLLIRHITLLRDHQAIPRIVFSEEIYSGRPRRRARMYKGITAYLDRVAVIVRQGQARRAIRSDLDPPTVAVMFLGLIQPASILWRMSDGRFDVTRHTERAWKVFRGAIETR
jgi:AcrR family transcriptional regulator